MNALVACSILRRRSRGSLCRITPALKPTSWLQQPHPLRVDLDELVLVLARGGLGLEARDLALLLEGRGRGGGRGRGRGGERGLEAGRPAGRRVGG